MDLWTRWRKERLGQIEKIALMYIHSLTLKVTQVSDSLRHHGLQPARLLYPWDFPSKNTEVGCHSLLQEMFPIQGSNLSLLHCRQIRYHLNHQGSPMYPHNLWEAAI